MTKIYVVCSARATKDGKIYTVIENVFSNRKKAENYIDWLNKDEAKINTLRVVRYYYNKWRIDTNDYSKIPY